MLNEYHFGEMMPAYQILNEIELGRLKLYGCLVLIFIRLTSTYVHMPNRATIDEFCESFYTKFTVMKNGEHCFIH